MERRRIGHIYRLERRIGHIFIKGGESGGKGKDEDKEYREQ